MVLVDEVVGGEEAHRPSAEASGLAGFYIGGWTRPRGTRQQSPAAVIAAANGIEQIATWRSGPASDTSFQARIYAWVAAGNAAPIPETLLSAVLSHPPTYRYGTVKLGLWTTMRSRSSHCAGKY